MEETKRICSLCGKIIDNQLQMSISNDIPSGERPWNFEGDHAHFDCYINHLVEKKIIKMFVITDTISGTPKFVEWGENTLTGNVSIWKPKEE